MAEANSSPSQTTSQRTKASWLNKHIFNKVRFFHLHLTVCIVGAISAVGLAILALCVIKDRPWTMGGEFGVQESTFCCPEEAMAMYHYVNVSINPCHDFFAYVCSDVSKSGRSDPWRIKLEQIMITGMAPAGIRSRQATDFLIRYHRTCVETIASPDGFISSLVDALWKYNQKLLANLTGENAMIYMMTASIKYTLPSAIIMRYNPGTWLVYFRSNDLCRVHSLQLDILTFVVRKLNIALNISESNETTVKFAKAVCVGLKGGKRQTIIYTGANLRHAYDGQVWTLDHLRAALAANGYSLRNRTALKVMHVQNVRAIHKIFSSEEHNVTQGVKAAYLLWHSVLEGVKQFSIETQGNPLGILEGCYKSVNAMKRMWQAFAAEILTTSEKDAQAGVIFAVVKEAVHSDCKRSLLFETTDTGRLNSFFEGLSLVTPLALNSSNVAVPEHAPQFGDNLLRGRTYHFEVEREFTRGARDEDALRYKKVMLKSLKKLYLSAEDYYHISDSKNTSWLPNMAVLGRLLAEAMWHAVFHGITWSPKATDKIKRFLACFVEFTNVSAQRAIEHDTLISTTLGLHSVLNALGGRQDWFKVRPAWSLWKLSHAQLFYIHGTSVRCPNKATSVRKYGINAPLTHLDGFAKAFLCPPQEPMATHSECLRPLRGH